MEKVNTLQVSSETPAVRVANLNVGIGFQEASMFDRRDQRKSFIRSI